MNNPLLQLVSDTLLYLKDPLHPKDCLLATEEEYALLKSIPQNALEPSTAIPLEKQQPLFSTERKGTPPPQKETPPLPTQPKPLPPTQQGMQPPPSSSPLIKTMLSKIAPNIRLVDSIPDDALGK